jgi:glutamyl/glutaminyl-tRNA synthetase
MDEPVFHLVVVIDDFEMGITHVIRGEDHISNTPRQILIYEAIGAAIPQYAHLPIVLAPDRSKLSGRKGALAVTEYRDRGYLPAALVNCMALVGWNAGIKNPDGSEPEIFTKDELIKIFDLSKVQKSGAIFNEEKLRSLNRAYMEKLSDQEFMEYVKKFTPEDVLQKINIEKFLPLLREKIYAFGEIKTLFAAGEDGSEGELSFITTIFDPEKPLPYKKESLMWRQEKDISQTKIHLKFVIDAIEKDDSLSDANITSFTPEKIKAAIWPYAEKIGKGNVLWPMRYALSGKDKSPDPITIASILGKSETLKRLKMAYDAI